MACERILSGDGGFMIVCGGSGRSKRCHFCPTVGTSQCDHPVSRRGKTVTCDLYLCSRHSASISPDVDLCPAHFAQYELNGNRLVLGDVALDPARPPRGEPNGAARLPSDAGKVYHILKPGHGWLGKLDAPAWVADRAQARRFLGGPVLDVSARVHGWQIYEVEDSLLETSKMESFDGRKPKQF